MPHTYYPLQLAAASLAALLLTACADGDEETALPAETHDITLRLNCRFADRATDSTLTRSRMAHAVYYENVINDLFALQFDADGICRAYSPFTAVLGSMTEVDDYAITLNNISAYAQNAQNTLYVFCNFGEDVYTDLTTRYTELTRSILQKETFSLYDFRELAANESHRTFLPACGIYKGAVTDGMRLDVILGRYLARVTLSLKAAADDTFTNLTVGMHNAPNRLQYIPADSSAAYNGTTFFTDGEMQDQSVISSLTTSGVVNRYFYVGENLYTDADLQTQIYITGSKKGTAFTKLLPLSTTGLVYRNTNYELELVLE